MFANYYLLLIVLVMKVNSFEIDLIRDYFEHRSVKQVVGFSCGDSHSRVILSIFLVMFLSKIFCQICLYKLIFTVLTDDIEAVKVLNTICSMGVMMIKPYKSMDVETLLYTNYTSLGVFIDLRCKDQHSAEIFHKVRFIYELVFSLLLFL